VIELEPAQIHPRDLHEADADEPVGEVSDGLVETNNLLVNGRAVRSGFAPKDEEDWLAGPLRLGLRGRVVGIPAEPDGVGLGRGSAGARRRQKNGAGRE